MSRSSVARAAALVALGVLAGMLLIVPTPLGARSTCPSGMTRVGKICVDRYEASVWSKPDGGTQFGIASDDYPCADDGHDCKGKIFARVVAGVVPSRYITWFQAQSALANVGKRLPTNAEWQIAAQGTPNAGTTPGADDCNTNSAGPTLTGSRASCKSAWGIYDAVGNVWELTSDWVAVSTACPGWGSFSDDVMCLSGASTTDQAPGVITRGSYFAGGTGAGVFAISGSPHPSDSDSARGLRGVR